jgi:hypothetical protein
LAEVSSAGSQAVGEEGEPRSRPKGKIGRRRVFETQTSRMNRKRGGKQGMIMGDKRG